MKDLFMCLLLNLTKHGKLVEANCYKSGEFSVIAIETEDGIYTVSISKEKKDGGKEDA